MKKSFFIPILFVSNLCFAQLLPVDSPNQFDKFIKTANIEWAIYNDDNIRFKGKNLNEILRTRFNKGEIKSSLQLDFSTQLNEKVIFYPADEINRIQFHPHDMPFFDSLGNIIDLTPAQKKSTPENLFDSSSYNVVSVLQIFYIENAILKSYVPFVNIKMSINTSTGVFLGLSNYFSTCFNYSYNYNPHAGNKIIFLSQIKKRMLQDSMYRSSKLKELYGKDLIGTLWPYILNEKLKITNITTNKKMPIDEIIRSVALTDSTRYPIDTLYYPLVNPSSAKLTLSYVTSLEVVQDWFYDYTQNIVFNKVRELIVYMRPWKKEDEGKEPAAVFKIVYN